MSIVTYNNRSIANISAIPGAAKSLIHIKTLTASSSSTLSFVDGSNDVVLDSTYPIYLFKFFDIHPSSNQNFSFNGSSDSGSNYNVTKTTTVFIAGHTESDSDATLTYQSGDDLAQSTAFQDLTAYGEQDDDNDHCLVGTLHLFNPSSTTFVKHFISHMQGVINPSYSVETYVSGYFDTTSVIDAVQFKMVSGNIDAGTIKLYGLKDS